MKFEAFERAQTSQELEKWQQRIVNEARAAYSLSLGEVEEDEREMMLNGFDGFAREVIARKKDEWQGELAKSDDAEARESQLAKGLVIAVKEEMNKLKEAA